MSTKFYTLLTDIGAAKLASAAALGVPLKITHMAVGDGGGVLPTPDAKQTALVNEKRRAALNMLYIDPQNSSQIIAEQVIPENEGGWWIREVGLFDESGALIAVGNCPESYKPQLAEGSGRTQTVRMVLITSSTDNITLKIDPAVVLATRKYVDDKISEHEQSRRHPDASLTAKGFTQLSSATNSESEILAATPKAVKAAYDLANGKQPADATLTALAGLATAADKLPYFTGNDTASLTTLTNVGRDILAKTSKQEVIRYLGLGDTSGYVGRRLSTRAFASSGTYTPSPETKRIRVTITGGGGGGGGCKATSNNETFFGAGGGAGGTVITILTPTQNSYPVTIGAG
ncbi:phage tail protein, partial [Escherichia coli]|nr:phage tail protein [Escherichia coli]